MSNTALQRADRGHGQPGVFGQRFLGQAGSPAIAPQLLAKGSPRSVQHVASPCASSDPAHRADRTRCANGAILAHLLPQFVAVLW